jgi:hypothetical protein
VERAHGVESRHILKICRKYVDALRFSILFLQIRFEVHYILFRIILAYE